MKLPNEKTFCVAPWFQVRNSNNGTKKVCCLSTENDSSSADLTPLEFLNSRNVINLKEKLHQGIQVDTCAKCWKAEKNGRVSLRQSLNGILTNNASTIKRTWIDSYFKQKNDFFSADVLMADIKIGNTCNYACVMCEPDNSSMIYNHWMQKPNAFFIKEKLREDPDYLEKVKTNGYRNQHYRHYVKKILENKNLKFIKILGGEPLMDTKLMKDLSALPDYRKKNLSLYIVTNASKDLLEIKKYLGEFKSLRFCISLEGISEVQDYARYGSNWRTVSENILKFKRAHPYDILIHTTLQTTTVLGFKDLAEWCSKHDLPLSIGVCVNPKYLSFSSLPDTVRNEVKESLETAKINVMQRSIGDEELWPVAKIIDLIKTMTFDESEYRNFLTYIKWYEEGKKIPKLKNIFPSLYVDDSVNIL